MLICSIFRLCLLVVGLVTPNVGSAVDQPGEVQSEHVSGSHVVEGNAPGLAPQRRHHHGEDKTGDNLKWPEESERIIQIRHERHYCKTILFHKLYLQTL